MTNFQEMAKEIKNLTPIPAGKSGTDHVLACDLSLIICIICMSFIIHEPDTRTKEIPVRTATANY